MEPKWITVEKTTELTGLSSEAIRNYRRKDKLSKEIHWIKAANGRIMIHWDNFNRFLEGKKAREVA